MNSAIAIVNLAVALQQLRKAGLVRDGSATDALVARQGDNGQTADSPVSGVLTVEPEIVGRAVVSVAALTARLERGPVTVVQPEAVAGEILYVAVPLKVVEGTGSPVNPVVIK